MHHSKVQTIKSSPSTSNLLLRSRKNTHSTLWKSQIPSEKTNVQNEAIIFNDLQINNHDKRGDPSKYAELDETVFDQRLGWGSTYTKDDHVLQITKHACKYPTARQIDITGSHSLDDFWRHGVHDVANQSDRSNDGCGFVDEGLVVTRNRNTRFLTRLFIDAVVVVALGEGQEERHQEGHHHQPMGDPNVCCDTTDEYSHHEADSDNRDIKDGILLQPDAVGDVHQPIRRHDHI